MATRIRFNPPLWPWLLYLLLFGLALIPRIWQLGAFWGTDERYHWQLSNEFFLALLRRDWASTVPQGLPGLTLAWIDAIAMLLRYGWAWLLSGGTASLEQIMAPERPFAQLAGRQVPVVLVNTLLAVAMFGLAAPVLGRKAAGLGFIFVAFDPFLLAESRVLRFEALVTGLMLLSLLATLRYLKVRLTIPQPGRFGGAGWLALSAVLAALAMLTKISAIFLLPATGLLGLATILGTKSTTQLPGEPAAGRRDNEPANSFTQIRHSSFIIHHSPFFHWLFAYLLWTGLVVFCFWLFWPAMWVAPAETLQTVKTFVETAGGEGVEGRGVFFWGQIYPDDPGPWFYPVALLFRLTPLALAGLVGALAGLALARRWRPGGDEEGWPGWAMLALLAYALSFFVMMSLGAKKYDRYLLPIFPALDLVAGAGWLWAIEWVKRRMGEWANRQSNTSSPTLPRRFGSPQLVFVGGWLILLALQSLTALPHLPYYYTYYNPLLGGPAQAVHYIRVGFDEGLDRVAAYLEAKPNAAQLKLASGNSSNFDGLFSGQTIALDNLDGKWVQADYVMIYISQVQRGKHAADILAYLARHRPEYTVTLHGLEYAWLYPGPAAQFYGGGHKLEGRGTLFGYSFCLLLSPCRGGEGVAAGDTLPVRLYWRNEGQLESDRFFVRLLDLDGYVWAEAIARPRPGFEAANRQANAIVESEAVLNLPAGMPPGDYFFKPGFRTDRGEIIGYFELPAKTRPIHVAAARTFPAPGEFHPPQPARITTHTDLALLGYRLEPEQALPGSTVWLTLYWQALADVSHDYVILVRLLDEQQQESAYWLGRPVRSGYPTTEWKAHQIVQDPWRLQAPAEAQPGLYTLEIALFDAATEREVVRDLLGKLAILPPATE